MASELRVNTLKDAAGNNSIATSFVAGGSAKAWVNFNGSTNATRSSLNIASVTDNGNGDYSYSTTSAYAAFDYLANGASYWSGTRECELDATNSTTSIIRMISGYTSNTSGGGTGTDSVYSQVITMGDLA